MTQKILILGGQGRIGSSIAADLLKHTDATVTVTGRRPPSPPAPQTDSPENAQGRRQTIALHLDNREKLQATVAAHHLVIHCAGPFSYRDDRVLRACINAGINYIDIADNPDYVRQAQSLCSQAEAAGVTAILSTGVFPGISNSMARQGVESLDSADTIHLSYIVAGSGGAGVTVMRTTFLELQHPINAWIDGQRRQVPPYSQREQIQFPAPYGRCPVYWFNTIEAATLPESFPVKTVITKFGSLPDLYNHLTWLIARLPGRWLQQPNTVEFLAKVSYDMTQFSDRFSGTGIAMRVAVTGTFDQQPAETVVTFTHTDTAAAVGAGTGTVAQQLLAGFQKPGVYPVEQALPTEAFLQGLHQRHLQTHLNTAVHQNSL